MTDRSSAGTRAVFFDLDGTLIDTAPDMVAVLQALQRRHGVAPVDFDTGRAQVSNGALGLLRLGFPGVEGDAQEALRLEFLDHYAGQLSRESTLFAGLAGLLERLDAADVPWGVVTNKPAHLTEPLLEDLDLARRSACTVSGDTLAVRKPDPGPLLHACELAGIRPEQGMYIGDALRDIEAGLAAGMSTIAAAYGYLVAGDDPARWGADAIAYDTEELTQIVLKAVNLDP